MIADRLLAELEPHVRDLIESICVSRAEIRSKDG
tara:strand:- start:5850 stop:5951 length:102 start_codon:yes stop_codon:yes gene_type:complete